MKTTEKKFFLKLAIPAGTEFPTSITKPMEEPGMERCKLSQLINWVGFQKLMPYWKNRGTGGVAKATVKAVRHNFDPTSFGEITFGWYEENGVNVLTIATGHSRIYGLLQRYLDGNVTPEELNFEISVRCVPDFMTAYKISGQPGPTHNSKEKVLNPDLTYGYPIQAIKNLLSPTLAAKLDDYSTPLSAMIEFQNEEFQNYQSWTVEEFKRASRWDNVYYRRGAVAHKSNALASEGLINVSQKQISRAAIAITNWYNFTVLTKHAAGNTSVSLVDKAGFFGLFVMERYSENDNFFQDNLALAKRVVNKPGAFEKPSTMLCKNNEEIYDNMQKIFKAFNANCKNKKEDPALVELNRMQNFEMRKMKEQLKIA